MRSIPFKTVFDKVVRLHGRDPRQPLSSDLAAAVVDHINDRVAMIAEGWRWPEWEITEERAFRQIWNAENQYLKHSLVDGRPDEVFYLGTAFDSVTGTLGADSGYYRVLSTALGDPVIGTVPTDTNYWVAITPFSDTNIEYDQGCQRSIGIVRGVYRGNPSCCGSNGVLKYMPSERGIVCGCGGNPTVFIKYSMPVPSYTMTPYVAGRTYARGSVVFDPATGECFQAIASTTAVPTNVTFWRWIPFLDKWSGYVCTGAFADSLMEFDQGGNAELQAKMVLNQYWNQNADDALQAQVDALTVQGQTLQYSFCRRVASCWCESEVWSGGTVTTLTDECKDGLGWVYPAQPVTPTEELGAEFRGITPLVNGQEYVDVTFSEAMANTRWILVEASIVNTVDGTPLNIWAGILTSRTTSGFRLQLNGIPNTDNYYLHWAVRAVTTVGEAVPTYSLSGPSSGRISVAATFTVALPEDLVILGTVTVTPSDSGGGGAFTPTSVELTADDPAATFTYTPASYGSKIISTTNDRGLIDPDAVAFLSTVASYTLSGPSSGSTGVASTDFTVAFPVGGAISGTAIITPSDGGGGGTFTPTTVNLTTAAPSATFTYTPASSGAKTISVTNNRGLTNPGNLSYTASAPTHLLSTLISYWKLDEASGTRNDSKGTNHLTDIGGTTGVAAIINNGANFGGGNALQVTNNSTLQVTSDFTFALWAKVTAGATSFLICKTDFGSNNDYYLILDGSTGFGFNAAGTLVSVGSLPSTGPWYYLVMWYDSSDGKVRLRVNDTTTYTSSGTVGSLVQGTTNVFVGAGNAGLAAAFGGVLDEIGFWKRKLTADEMTALYNGGAGLPFSSFTA